MAEEDQPRPIGIGWVVTWPLLPIFALMLFLTAQEVRRPGDEPFKIQGGPGWEERLHARIEALTAALQRSSLELSTPVETMTGSGTVRYVHRGYTVTFRPERQIETELAIEALRDVDPGVTLTRTPIEPDGFEVRVGLDGLLTHTLRVRPLQPAAAPPRAALVARALGDDLRLAREMVAVDAPIALAVRAGRPFSKEVAELGHMFGREVVLDVVLVPTSGETESEPSVISLDSGLRSSMEKALQSVPYAVGVTADVTVNPAGGGERLESLLEELSRRGLFWIPSVDVRGSGVARSIGKPLITVASFRVGEKQNENLEKRLDEIRQQARGEPVALTFVASAIGGAGPATEMARRLRAAGIEVVPVSGLSQAPTAASVP